MLIGICLRVKDEDIILNEFIIHHINLGFDKIHIYDNNSIIPVEELCKKIIKLYPDKIFVEKDTSINPSDPNWGQTLRYNEFLNKNRHFTWILNCDADEFIYLHKHNNIKDFLSEFSDDTSVIPVNWLTFGTSKLNYFDKNKLVMEQFVLREDYKCFWNYFRKSFIRPNLITKIKNWHFHDSEQYLTRNVYNEIIIKSSESTFKFCEEERNKLNDDTPMVMIHYMTLDYENMEKKHNKNKGMLIGINDDKYTKEWYKQKFKDNVVDTRMLKYINDIKKILFVR
jgi:hypothetical protein